MNLDIQKSSGITGFTKVHFRFATKSGLAAYRIPEKSIGHTISNTAHIAYK